MQFQLGVPEAYGSDSFDELLVLQGLGSTDKSLVNCFYLQMDGGEYLS